MARPIKETPILFGEDARRLREAMENVVPEPHEKQVKMKADYEYFMRMFNRRKREEEEARAAQSGTV